MNIAIIGRTEILYNSVKLLNKKGYNISVVITSKEAPEYKKTVQDFKDLAYKLGSIFIYAPKLGKREISILKSLKLDIGVSMNYTGIIQQEVIDIFPLGILNAHGGDLPKYRGNACQAWAILNGEDKIGLCIHKMEGDKLDSGDIIERRYYKIDLYTKITDIYNWFYRDIPEMFVSAIEKLKVNKNYYLKKQDEKEALRCYPLLPEDGKIDWQKDSRIMIIRKINAFSKPYQGAFCFYKGRKIVFLDAKLYDDNEKYCSFSGQIAKINKDGSIIVIAKDGKILIEKIQVEGNILKPAEIFKSIRGRLF